MENIAGIARSAMLVELTISLYSGRKQDKSTQAEVVAAKGSGSKRAASVYKNLFSDCAELEAITKFQARARADHYRMTLPWSDSGLRLLPTKALFDYQAMISKAQEEFDTLVGKFLDRYDTLVAAAAFQLGALFNRSEYLTREQVARRFSMSVSMAPLPVAGDFRLDIEAEVQNDLVRQYEERMQQQLVKANQEAWERLHTVLAAMSDRLTIEETEEGPKKRVFRDTLVTNAEELCGLLTSLNVANDPALERARARLESALVGVTPKDLRESEATRVATKQKVDSILSDFDWFATEGDE